MKKENNIPNFKVPEGYFESFEEQLFSKISEEKFPKSNGFKVPNGYFEKLEVQVFNTLENSEKPKKVISLFPKKYLGYAAAIAASVVIGFSLFNNDQGSQNIDILQWSAIDSYINEGNLNLDLYDLTTMIDDSDLSGIDFRTQQLSEKAMEDYLFENIDSEILINER